MSKSHCSALQQNIDQFTADDDHARLLQPAGSPNKTARTAAEIAPVDRRREI